MPLGTIAYISVKTDKMSHSVKPVTLPTGPGA